MKEMIKEAFDFFETLPFWATTAIVAALSGILSIPANYWPLSRFRWPIILITPFIIAYVVYCSPVWLGADPSEYSVWAPLFIISWYLAGGALSALFALLLKKLGTSLAKRSLESK